MAERSLESIAADDRQSGGFVSRAVRLHVSLSGSLMLPDIVLGYLVSVRLPTQSAQTGQENFIWYHDILTWALFNNFCYNNFHFGLVQGNFA